MAVSFCARRLLLPRSSCYAMSKRTGYIVLLPEIGEDVTGKNPLLKDDKFPEFNNITIEKCKSAIVRQTLEFEDAIKAIGNQIHEKENYDVVKDILNPVEDVFVPLNITWGIAKTLYFGNESLLPSKDYFDIHFRVERASNSRLVNEHMYRAYQKALESKDSNLTDEQKMLISKYVLEGKLNGLGLPEGKDKSVHDFSRKKIAYISQEYKDKFQAGQKVVKLRITDLDIAAALPERLLKACAADPTQPHVGPWKISMFPHIYDMFMEYCPDRVLRWKAWDTYVTVGSLYRERYIQLSSPLENLRYRRKEEAKALGYDSYFHMNMETKMAGTVENVLNTFNIIREAAYPCQIQEINELTTFANDRGLENEIRLWDIPYWTKKHYNHKHNIDIESLQDYFPLPKVLNGLFQLVETLFDIKIVEAKKEVDVWHKDVRFFDVFDLKKQSTKPIANFYLDPYAREHTKTTLIQGDGVVMPVKGRSKLCGNSPLVSLIFSFSPPTENKPSLLSFSEIKSLFRTVGSSLRYLLTESENADTIMFVEPDFAHVTRYFMENWLYDTSILQQISGHYATDESLPPKIIETLKNVKTYFTGYKMCNELYLAHLDLELYSNEDFWVPIMDNLWKRYLVLPNEKRNCHVVSFYDIIVGGSQASYYSYIWSQMIAADLYGAFEEIPSNDKEQQKQVGNRYRETILAFSGIYPANELFRRFRGRDYCPKALLKNLGLENNTTIPK